jgi:hypothetical protein
MCPTYLFRNNETGEEYEEFMSISALETYLEETPNVTQLVNGAPMIHSGRGMNKPDAGFRDLLKHIKKGNQKGISRSTINTF